MQSRLMMGIRRQSIFGWRRVLFQMGHPITLRLCLCSWDVFPYDLFPNQLRPTDLLLGQVSNGGGWNYGILASPVATGEVASAASR